VAARPVESSPSYVACYLERRAMCEKKSMSGVLLCLLSLMLQAILALVGLVALAGASELSRADYVHQAEPICKANTTANRSILKGTREDVREGRLKQAGRKFGRAARALDRTIQRLEQLPRPVPDENCDITRM
jgi:hypothetical protein